MRVLIMGGTLFLGRHIVEAALKRGHEVTLFNRGVQNPTLFPEAEKLTGERNTNLAGWLVRLTEQRVAGVFQATGPQYTLTMGQFLDECVRIAGNGAELVWIPDDGIRAAGIEGWTELPLWVAQDDPEAGGIFEADIRRAIGWGLALRPAAQTIRDTLQWCRETGGEVADPTLRAQTLSADKERQTLARVRPL